MEIGRLQVQAMQDTLQELVNAQQPSGLHEVRGPTPRVLGQDPGELSIAAFDNLQSLQDPSLMSAACPCLIWGKVPPRPWNLEDRSL